MISVNERAAVIVRQMIDDAEALGLEVTQLGSGTTIVDAGIHASGSYEAGRLYACACMGGLGQVGFTHQVFAAADSAAESPFWLPAVSVTVARPHIACMASQYAGWAIKLGRFFAIGSGPARALYAGEDLYGKLEYRDRARAGVLMLEGRELPGEEVAGFIAEKCGIRAEDLALLIAPTASIAGSVQIAARSAETGLHKLSELGFDTRCVTAASGECPLAPPAADDVRAIGRTNDAILYGARVFYTVRAEDEDLAALIDRVPSSGSRDYGVPFYQLFMRHNGDFYKIDPLLFSPAEVEINNLNSGRTFRAGRVHPSILKSSLLGS